MVLTAVLFVSSESPSPVHAEGEALGFSFCCCYFFQEKLWTYFKTMIPMLYILTQSGLLGSERREKCGVEKRIACLASKIWLECQVFCSPAVAPRKSQEL